MAYEQKINTGSLWPNADRKTETHPNSKGSVLLQCPNCQHITPWWQSGWTKIRQSDGVRWVSQSFKPKDAQPAAAPPPPKADADDPFADDIPF